MEKQIELKRYEIKAINMELKKNKKNMMKSLKKLKKHKITFNYIKFMNMQCHIKK